MSHVRTALRNQALHALLARGAGMAGALAMGIALTRTLPKSGAGLVVFAYTLLTLASALTRFGTDNLALREVSRNDPSTTDIVHNCYRTAVVIAPLAATAVALSLVARGGKDVSVVALGAALATLPAALSVLSGAVLKGVNQVALGALAELGSSTIFATAALVCLGIGGYASTTAAMWAITAGYAFTAAWSVPLALRAVRRRGGISVAMSWQHFVLRYRASLLSFTVTTIGFFLFTVMPVLALGFTIRSPTESQYQIALFNASASLTQFILVVETIQISYLSRVFASNFHQGNLAEVNRTARLASMQSSLWGAVIGAMFIVAPEFFLRIYGSYGEASTATRILTIGAFVVVAMGPVNGLMLTCGHEHQAGTYTFILLVIGCIALPILTRWGHIGAATGIAAISTTYAVLCAISLRRSGIRAAWFLRSRPL